MQFFIANKHANAFYKKKKIQIVWQMKDSTEILEQSSKHEQNVK